MHRIRSELLEPGLLRAARTAAGYEQAELAGRAGISTETISRIERSVAKRIYDVVDSSIRSALAQGGVTVRHGDGDALLVEIARHTRRPTPPAHRMTGDP